MLALIFAIAIAQDQGPPSWTLRPQPSPDDYPMIARHLSLPGRVIVECNIDTTGIPTNCVAVSSQPAHLGFDQAAINIVQRGRLPPHDSASGNKVERFRIAVPFQTRPLNPDPTKDWPTPNTAQLEAGRSFAVRTINPRRSYAAMFRQTWRLDRLPNEQQQAITSWIEELAPTRQQDIDQTAQAIARLLAKHDMQSLPEKLPTDDPNFNRDFTNAARGHLAPMVAEISLRYCATFTCAAD